jgi:hypothetical protein
MSDTALLAIVGLLSLLVLLISLRIVRAARDVRLGRHVEKARKRMKDPAAGAFTVIAITPPSSEAIWAMAEITGIVSAPGLDPCPVQRPALLRTALWPSPGQTLPVLVDRAKPDSFVVIWSKVKSGSEAALDEAQRLAAEMKAGSG